MDLDLFVCQMTSCSVWLQGVHSVRIGLMGYITTQILGNSCVHATEIDRIATVNTDLVRIIHHVTICKTMYVT